MTRQADRTNKCVTITLPPWALVKLAALAKAKKLTKSGVVQELLQKAKVG
jgi:hypothetical protein